MDVNFTGALTRWKSPVGNICLFLFRTLSTLLSSLHRRESCFNEKFPKTKIQNNIKLCKFCLNLLIKSIFIFYRMRIISLAVCNLMERVGQFSNNGALAACYLVGYHPPPPGPPSSRSPPPPSARTQRMISTSDPPPRQGPPRRRIVSAAEIPWWRGRRRHLL